MATPLSSRGLILGKFYPPHLGHEYLIRFACASVDKLTVVVEHIPGETIPAQTRLNWLANLIPSAEFLLLHDCNPQHPEEHPEFWSIWQRSLLNLLPEPIDYVFASEPYGTPLAACLNAKFIPVDMQRQRFAISGTRARAAPYQCWPLLSRPTQRYFQKRVCICGPESTGKTTLSKWLVNNLNSQYSDICRTVPEYARAYLQQASKPLNITDMLHIARGQFISETTDCGTLTPLLICDTGVDASKVWSEFLFAHSSPELDSLCSNSHYDLYLICAPDVPWVDDGLRYLPKAGKAFFQRLLTLIHSKAAPNTVIEISGTWAEREQKALLACHSLLQQKNNHSGTREV